MELVVTELDTTLDQLITSNSPNYIRHIRPWVYIEGAPGGDLELEIRNAANDTVLATSNSVSVATIKTAFSGSNNYTHGFYQFDIDFGAAQNTNYNVRLKGVNGYTFGASDYAAWIVTGKPCV